MNTNMVFNAPFISSIQAASFLTSNCSEQLSPEITGKAKIKTYYYPENFFKTNDAKYVSPSTINPLPALCMYPGSSLIYKPISLNGDKITIRFNMVFDQICGLPNNHFGIDFLCEEFKNSFFIKINSDGFITIDVHDKDGVCLGREINLGFLPIRFFPNVTKNACTLIFTIDFSKKKVCLYAHGYLSVPFVGLGLLEVNNIGKEFAIKSEDNELFEKGHRSKKDVQGSLIISNSFSGNEKIYLYNFSIYNRIYKEYFDNFYKDICLEADKLSLDQHAFETLYHRLP